MTTSPEKKFFRSKYPDRKKAIQSILPLDGKGVGDILISINETVSNQFAEIESILDESVAKKITVVDGERAFHKISLFLICMK